MLRLIHRETGGEHTSTREAFDLVWAAKGWEIAEDLDPDESTGSTAAVAPVALEALDLSALHARAEELGVEHRAEDTWDELVERLRAAGAEEA